MKIAILFSGRVRQFGKHYRNIMDNIVQEHDADFYLSHSPELDEDLDIFCELYQPIAVCNDPIPEFDYSKYIIIAGLFTKPRNVYCMYFNRERVFNLLGQNARNYDCIVSYRLDAFAYEPLNLDSVKENKGAIFIPDCADHYGGINDQIAFGAYEPMRIYMNTFGSMIDILDDGCHLHPEVINRVYLEKSGVPIIRVPFDYELRSLTTMPA